MLETNVSKNHKSSTISIFSAQTAFSESLSWIEKILGESFHLNEDFRKILADGIILCRAINKISPNIIPHTSYDRSVRDAKENLANFLTACKISFNISQENLFTLDDFEDLLTQTNKKTYEECQKSAEKIAVTIFWLAKSLEQSTCFPNLPKLNYSCFAAILPESIRTKPVNNYHSNSINITHSPNQKIIITTSNSGKDLAGDSMKTNQTTISKPKHPISNNTNDKIDSSRANTITSNNNCFEGDEEEDWQSKLDSWREKRRSILRVEARNVSQLEEREREESERRKSEVINRLRQARNQRNSVGSQQISSLDFVPPSIANSPGVALLKGNATVDIDEWPNRKSSTSAYLLSCIEDQSADESKDVDDDNKKTMLTTATTITTTTTTKPTIKTTSNIGDNYEINKSKTLLIKDNNNCDKLKSDKFNPIQVCHKLQTVGENKQSDYLPLNIADYHELKFKFFSKANVCIYQWGLTIKALGPSSTAPFVIERVKIGSPADLCDIMKGDILLCLDGINLGVDYPTTNNAPNKSINKLNELQILIHQLGNRNKLITINVLRKKDECGDDYLYCSNKTSQNVSPSNVSDVEENVRELIINEKTNSPNSTAANSNKALKYESKFVSHYINNDKEERSGRSIADIDKLGPDITNVRNSNFKSDSHDLENDTVRAIILN